MKATGVEGSFQVGEKVFTHALQLGTRYNNAVCETVRGVSHDFNPWDRYAVDAGYCLDAPCSLPAGSHVPYSCGSVDAFHVFSKEVFRAE